MVADKKKSVGMSFGGSTLILIFAVLCMTTFSVLALVSANADYKLTEKTAQMISEYYTADSLGEEYLQRVDEFLNQQLVKSIDEEHYYQNIVAELGEDFDIANKMISYEFQVNTRLKLVIGLEIAYQNGGKPLYQIKRWRTEQTGEYDIDNSMPVWTGNEVDK